MSKSTFSVKSKGLIDLCKSGIMYDKESNPEVVHKHKRKLMGLIKEIVTSKSGDLSISDKALEDITDVLLCDNRKKGEKGLSLADIKHNTIQGLQWIIQQLPNRDTKKRGKFHEVNDVREVVLHSVKDLGRIFFLRKNGKRIVIFVDPTHAYTKEKLESRAKTALDEAR